VNQVFHWDVIHMTVPFICPPTTLNFTMLGKDSNTTEFNHDWNISLLFAIFYQLADTSTGCPKKNVTFVRLWVYDLGRGVLGVRNNSKNFWNKKYKVFWQNFIVERTMIECSWSRRVFFGNKANEAKSILLYS